MKYETPELKIEKFESIDIMVSSTEEPTVPQGTDPYVADKF